METKEMNIYDKLSRIQTELKAPKGQFNSFGKYKYRSCEDIVESIKPHLQEHGLVLLLSDEIVLIGERYYIKASAILHDGKNTVTNVGFAREEESKKGMDGSQITGTASSYARKYALNGLLAIDDTKDSDATNTHGKSNPQTPQEATQEPVAKDNPISNEFVGEDEVKALEAEIERTGADLEKLLIFYKAKSLSDMKMSDFYKCVKALEKKPTI